MRSILFGLAIGLLGTSASQGGEAINSWAEIRSSFVKCWTVPRGTEGSIVAFRFLFSPSGGLRGPPRVLARILEGDAEARRSYEASAYAALDRCLPFAITPDFRAVMGETQVQLRFVNTPRKPALNLGPAITIFAEEAQRD